MRDAAKAAQLGHLLHLQSLVGQQRGGLVHAGLQKILPRRGIEKDFVIMVKLALAQMTLLTQPLDGPCLIAVLQHPQPQLLQALPQ